MFSQNNPQTTSGPAHNVSNMREGPEVGTGCRRGQPQAPEQLFPVQSLHATTEIERKRLL